MLNEDKAGVLSGGPARQAILVARRPHAPGRSRRAPIHAVDASAQTHPSTPLHSARDAFVALLCHVLLAVALVAPTIASGQSPPPDPRFGAVEAFRAPADAAELGLGWERIIFLWSELQPNGPEEWNIFHVEDGWLADAAAHSRQVVGLLEGTPTWATDGSRGAGVPRGLYLPIDDPANLWATFVRTIVRRYAGRIDHWIVWNEPDIAPGEYGVQWEGSVADFVQLTKVAYLVAHQENPNAVIHFAGLTYWHDVVNGRPLYLQRYLDEAREDPDAAAHNYYFDVISLHIYFTTDSVYDITAEFAALLRRNGLSQPIWINETNAPPFDDPLNPWTIPDWEVTLDQQAGFIVQAFAQGLAAGAERVAVYKLIDFPPYPPGYEPYGLVRADGTRRPAFEAMRAAVSHFSGARSAQMDRTAARSIVTLDRGGKTTRVLWARGRSRVTASLPALAPQALLVTHLGATQVITPVDGAYRLTLPGAQCETLHGCAVGGAPLILVEDAPANSALAPAGDATPVAATPTASPTPTPTPTLTPTPSPTHTSTTTVTATRGASSTPTPVQAALITPDASRALIFFVLAFMAGAILAIWLGARPGRGGPDRTEK